MRFVFFKPPKPKKFHIHARYHDPELERMRKRKAEMGYEEALTHEDELRMQIRKRWRKGEAPEGNFQDFGMSKNISYLIYFILIGGGIYLIFFTDFIDKLLMLFGVGKVK
jgi:hypothetical protein